MKTSRLLFAALLAGSFATGACSAAPTDGADDDLVEVTSEVSEAATASLALTEFQDPDAAIPEGVVRRVITSARAYEALFGSRAPGVDFRRELVVFYGAGLMRTGGYDANVLRVRAAGATLHVTTQLVSPGRDCVVTMALTKPHVFVKVARPAQALRRVAWTRADEVRDCTRPSCATLRCERGTHCEMIQPYCITTPCYPIPQCVPDNPCELVDCRPGDTCVVRNGQAVCELAPGGCRTEADCVLWDNYCGGCACDALGHNQRPVTCENPVNCFARPCEGKVAKCELGRCSLR